jgi:TolB protein
VKRALAAAVLAASLIIPSAPAQAAVDISLDRSRDRFNLGLSDFMADGSGLAAGTPDTVTSTIAGDLKFSVLFNLVEKGPLVRKRNDALGWKKLGSDVVVSGEVRKRGESIEIDATLTDTSSGKELLGVKKKGPPAQIRDLAHDVSNDIVKYFTGQKGIFTSKLVFVNNATGRKELYISDYDGKNARRLTNDNSIVILPRLSPDGQKIVFTSYLAGNPDMYVMNRDGSGRRKLSSKAGLNVSPSWTPNSDGIAVTLSIDGPPNIYLMDLAGNVKQRLTNHTGADTAPTFSPDGSQIGFTSDRAGNPHIYIMNLDGSGLRRITTASHCDSAAWSPDGQNIVYVKGGGRERFDIYSIEVLTGVERRLTWGTGDSENPAWSPDGRFVLFTSNRRGKYELFQMQADGSEQKPVFVNNGQSFTPHWSN